MRGYTSAGFSGGGMKDIFGKYGKLRREDSLKSVHWHHWWQVDDDGFLVVGLRCENVLVGYTRRFWRE